MAKNISVINKIKKFNNDLDREYGSGKSNKKDTTIGILIFVCLFIYSTFMAFNNLNKLFILIAFVYLMAISFSALMILFLGWLYYSPSNNIENKKKKTFLKISFIFSISLFFGLFLPVLILKFAIDKISKLLGIQMFTRNIQVIILDLLVYILAYLSCVGISSIYEHNIIEYLCIIFIIYFITFYLRKVIFKINYFISFREKYEYLYKSRTALICIIYILTMLSSVSGLYISKYNNGEFSAVIIFYIMPIIIFSGLEQIVLFIKQVNSKQKRFIQELYEELVILHDIAYPQITNFSCIKIKINISIKPYVIENYKNYFFSKKKDKIIIETLNTCKYMIQKEYNIYIEKEKQNFENDLFKNIDNLAKCLTIMK